MINRRFARTNGFVLITSLIFLVAMTIAVVYAVRSATMRERLAGNERVRSQAFQMAELAMTRAQGRLVDDPLSFGSKPGWVNITTNLQPRENWVATSTTTCAIDDANCNDKEGSNLTKTIYISGVAVQPRWAIKEMTPPAGTSTDCTFYEVWSHGVGSSAESSVLLRSVVRACDS
ncbi:pilus assembly PilX family protein [Chitinilyticum aquatile]|uniref:pilus assembly PilX family protein n=1 Tax=Chitinilyticum aquatile TaxID=362520 RepID=UPI0009D69AE7|nr:PilX N-terminal domain-containing pilus assembly protein [Chitinilyticum aquatile]